MENLSQIRHFFRVSKQVANRASNAFARRGLALTGAFLLGASAIALPIQPAEAVFGLFSNPEDKQARGKVPGRRRGGARRGTCSETENPLLALTSATEVETDTLPEIYVGGMTTAEQPTFWFDVPYALTDELTAEFVLQDIQGQDVYRTTSAEFSLPNQTPGIVSVSVSGEARLEIGKAYQWYFKVDCGSESPLYVQGGIERVALSPQTQSQIAAASSLEKAAIYQENEIWYDAIDTIASLYLTQPSDPGIRTAWTDLLRSLNL